MPGLMIGMVLGTVVTLLFVLELLSVFKWNPHITISYRIDRALTEPDEVATLSYRICNSAFWPMPTVSVCFRFEDAVTLHEDSPNCDRRNRTYTVDTCLLPHKTIRGTIRFSIRERGAFMLGRTYIETGDLLGLRGATRSDEIPLRVVCTARYLDDLPESETLGGFLGDISVRRFILEDPSLVLGYREYTGAEPMKSISWTQTARTGQLTVKKHDFTIDADVTVLLDMEACLKPLSERCLSLVRTVCDELEKGQIPFVVLSNGDLYADHKGSSRLHNFEIQRMIGLSRFVRYQNFSRLLNRCALDSSRRGYIVIVPRVNPEIEAGLRRLQTTTDTRLCVLKGEEACADA